MKSPHTDFGTYTGGRDDLLNLWSYIAVGASAIRSFAFTAIYSLPFCSLPGLLAFFLLLHCFLVYVHHLVWVGGAEQTTRAVPDGRQFVFLLRVSSDELANTVAFELKMPLHATCKMFLRK